ncbi:hypothetical protein [Scytonema millei]|nr:hypothetical protein [Scytonema millei]
MGTRYPSCSPVTTISIYLSPCADPSGCASGVTGGGISSVSGGIASG